MGSPHAYSCFEDLVCVRACGAQMRSQRYSLLVVVPIPHNETMRPLRRSLEFFSCLESKIELQVITFWFSKFIAALRRIPTDHHALAVAVAWVRRLRI